MRTHIQKKGDKKSRKREPAADRVLMQRAKLGDKAAWGELYLAYRPVALKAARQILANEDLIDDIASEVLAKVWDKVGQYDPQYSVSTWVYRMATNASIDIKRRDKVVRFHSLESAGENDDAPRHDPADESAAVSPEANVVRKETQARVQLVVDGLPEPYRTTLIQREFLHMGYDEIAKHAECTISTARWRFSEAMQLFETAWKVRFGLDVGA